ncbi:MAG: hypothetical protein M3410_08100 [Acidobacteriota bacterium]|nr:hypothetical protein [Acidobacteriota bacterium]
MSRNHLAEVIDTPAQERRRCWPMFDWLCKLFIILFCKRPKTEVPCLYLPERVINRPDPCIYSQFMLMQLNQPVTWDNPDVALFRNGVEQYTYDLQVDTDYVVEITVHNSSRKKPANGTQVAVQWIEFGAGAQIQHPIANLSANVPIWPGTTKVNTTWRTPASPGHYCIEVELSHPDDGNPANNRGWNNTDVRAAASELQVPIRIFNRWLKGCPPVEEGGRHLDLLWALFGWGFLGVLGGVGAVHHNADAQTLAIRAVAGYLVGSIIGLIAEVALTRSFRRAAPPRPRPDEVPCNLAELTVDSHVFHDAIGKDADPKVMFAPRPPAWPARVDPHLFYFAEGEAFRDVNLIVQAPDAHGLAEVFNVNSRQGGMPTGGVTVTVTT